MHRNAMIVVVALSTLTLLLLSACGLTPEPPPVKTVLLVRHAEKASCPSGNPNCDPPLTGQGAARADELAHVAEMAEVKAIYTTDTLRTRSTVEPLANALSLQWTLYTTPADVASAVQSKPDGYTVLVAGHSNTLPWIVTALGGSASVCPEGYEFDKLCVVTIHKDGRVNVVHLQYSATSVPDTGEGQTSTAKIRSGGPGGAALATAVALVPAPQTTGRQSLATFVFSPAIPVNPGQTYVIEWLAPGGVYLGWMAAENNPYPSGTAFGCTGIAIPAEDFIFTTYQDPMAVNADQESQAQTGLSRHCGTPPQGSIYQSFTPSVSPLAALDLRVRAGGQFPTAAPHEMTTVVLVRDAQSGAAAERAAALAQVMVQAGVTAVYASPTGSVVQRIADLRGLDVQTFSPDDIEGFVGSLLAEHPNQVVLVASTVDTLIDIIRELGGRPIPSVATDDLDDLFLVTVYEQGAAQVLRLQYGQASP